MSPLLLVLLALGPVGKTGASFDAEAQSLEARGVAAADPRAPSADVARVKAERQARVDATDKLRRALSALGHRGEPATDTTLLDKAATKGLDYGADGSVTLTLVLSTDGLGLAKTAHKNADEHRKAK